MKYLFVVIFATMVHAQDHRTVTPAGNYFQFDTIRPMFYTLKWGNDRINREYPDTIYCHYNTPSFMGENKNAIVLEVTPANYGWYALVLPLNDSSETLQFQQAYAYDITRNLIAYCDDWDVDTDTTLVVENFVTKEKHYFNAENSRYFSSIPCFRIIKAEFRGDSLHYKWGSIDPTKPDTKIYKSKTVPHGFSRHR